MLLLYVSLKMILSFETDVAVLTLESVGAMFRLRIPVEGLAKHLHVALITRDLLLPGRRS
jgi:hypothetical protein